MMMNQSQHEPLDEFSFAFAHTMPSPRKLSTRWCARAFMMRRLHVQYSVPGQSSPRTYKGRAHGRRSGCCGTGSRPLSCSNAIFINAVGLKTPESKLVAEIILIAAQRLKVATFTVKVKVLSFSLFNTFTANKIWYGVVWCGVVWCGVLKEGNNSLESTNRLLCYCRKLQS